jgi:hypothetical protein
MEGDVYGFTLLDSGSHKSFRAGLSISKNCPSGIFFSANSRKCCIALNTKHSFRIMTRILLGNGQSLTRSALRLPCLSSSAISRRDNADIPSPAPTRRLMVSGHHTSIRFRNSILFAPSQRVTIECVSDGASRWIKSQSERSSALTMRLSEIG